jgi:chromosome segregation ATPase
MATAARLRRRIRTRGGTMQNPNDSAAGGQDPGRRDPLKELQARLEAAIDEARPKIRKALEELDTRVDEAMADIRPKAQGAMDEVRPRVDQFVADVQPRLDSLLKRLQVRIDDLRRDLDERAARTAARARDEPAEPAGELPRAASEPPPEEGPGAPGTMP